MAILLNAEDGTNKDDTIVGSANDDVINAGNGNDLVFGNAGNDRLLGGNGSDRVFGGSGNDIIGTLNADATLRNAGAGDNGGDTLYGDGFEDWEQYKNAIGGAGNTASVTTAMGNDVIFGGNGKDTIWGDNGNNATGTGAGGADIIYAGNGVDTVYGEGGSDVLVGENGADILYGGSGSDFFVYNAVNESSGSGYDTIKDFSEFKDANTTDNDKIDLRPLLSGGFGQVGGGSYNSDNSDATDAAKLNWGGMSPIEKGVWFKHVDTNGDSIADTTMVYADTDGNLLTGTDGGAELVIKLEGIHHLTNNDFLGVKNAAPTLAAENAGTLSDTAVDDDFGNLIGQLDGSDHDFGAVLTYSLAAGEDGTSDYGTLTVNPDGTYTFVPDDAAINGLDSGAVINQTFSVQVSDGITSTTAVLTVTLNSANDTPELAAVDAIPLVDTAGADTYEDVNGNLAGTDRDDGEVLTYGIDGGTLGSYLADAYDVSKEGTYGTLYVNSGTGAYKFVVDAEAVNAEDSDDNPIAPEEFTVTVSDGDETVNQTLAINVTGANDTPELAAVDAIPLVDTAGADTYEDVNGNLAGTDRDDGEVLTYGIDGGTLGSYLADAYDVSKEGTYGTLYVNSGTGAYKFVVDAEAVNAEDSDDNPIAPEEFTVTVSDGDETVNQTLAINVTGADEAAVNVAPVANNVVVSGNEDTTITVTLAGTDTDGGIASYTLTSLPANGTLYTNAALTTLAVTGTPYTSNVFYYKPNLNYNGNASFSFTVTDDDGASDATPATVSITVNPVNDAPVANNDSLFITNNTTAIIAVNTLLGNDTDVDGLALSISSVGSPTGAVNSVTLNADGTITVGVVGGSSGTFQYTVSDGAGGTTTATVTVTTVSLTGSGDTIVLSGPYQGSYIDPSGGGDSVTGAGSAPDVFIGGAGQDTLIGSGGNDLLIGGDGTGGPAGSNDDSLSGGGGDDTLRGGAGNDTLDGGVGVDLLDFSDASAGFTFVLNSGATDVNGRFTSTIVGTDKYKEMEGVIGSSGADNITGDGGDNVIRGGAGNDTINGMGGIDLLDLSDGTAGINFTLQAGSGVNVNLSSIGLSTATGDTYSFMEGVIGTNFNDTLNGTNAGDVLMGGGGNDVLNGNGGNDTLIGGSGADTMSGGLGSDTFVWRAGDASAVDTITDFTTGAGGDALNLKDLLTGYDSLNPDLFVSLRESGTNTIVSVDRDGAGTAYGFQDVVVLENVSGVTVSLLITNGNLINS